MTEKEKMLAGELYDAYHCNELTDDRRRAKDLCHDFNALRPSDTESQLHILHQLLAHVGENAIVTPSFWCDYGYNIVLGDRFFANHNLVILDCNRVHFGNDVFVGPNCGFYTAGHPLDYRQRNLGLEYAKPITVGDNVWIGGGVHVMPGVTIGNNVVIGGGSTVVKDIPSNSVAVGNPCRVVKRL